MNGRYGNKVILVTGAGRGMGRAVAEAFAGEEATVVVAARTPARGEETVRDIVARGGKASLVCGDLSDRAAVQAMFAAVEERYGQLDVVVHCAADNAHGRVVDMDDAAYDYLIKSNIYSLFWIAKDAAPLLSRACDKGRLIFISSAMANRTYMPGLTPYTASKAYMNAFARGLAAEMGAMNILVNVIEPGMIASDRLKSQVSDAQASAISATFPVPRTGEPAEIAAGVLFLASNDAAYMTGASLLMDGGVSLVPLTGLSLK
ncbi:MAG: SDR family NAD(P)-dependent oxidoreductase [Janthinobacterium lividum]